MMNQDINIENKETKTLFFFSNTKVNHTYLFFGGPLQFSKSKHNNIRLKSAVITLNTSSLQAV